jgi:type IV pilus assembly protein PilQ
MEKRDIEGTAMHVKKDIQLKGILTGRWGQFMDSRKTGVHLGLALALLVLPALSAWASSDVTAANYSSNDSGGVVITLSTTGDAPKVSVFATESPARIILDLADTNSQVDANPVSVGIGAVQKFTTLAAGGRTRVMVDLSKMVTYDYQSGNGQVVLTLSGNGTPAVAQQQSQGGLSKFTVGNIDFRRGEDGQGKVIISLDQGSSNVSVNSREGGLSVDIFDADLPDALVQRLDVMDFATPVQMIDAGRKADAVRVELEISGLYEHMAYQSGNDWVIEVSKLAATTYDASKEVIEFYQDKEYSGARVTFNFQDIPVRSVLQLIADVSDLNIVVADNVSGNLTLRLTNVPWDQALDIVLDARNLDKRENGNVIWIAPTADIAAREQQLLQAIEDRKELEPLVTSLVSVSYATAEDLQALIDSARANSKGGDDGGLLSERGTIAIDARTNTLLITDTPSRVEAIEKLVRDLDRPVRQVQIESRIVIASSEFAHAIGVRFGVTALHDARNILAIAADGEGADLVNPATDPRDDGLIDLPGIPERYNVNLPVADSNAGSIGLSFLAGNVLLDLELTALEAEGEGEIISTPRVVTANQSEAFIQQGVEIPYEQAASSGATAVQFKEAVLELRATPLITPDNRVQLELEVKQDSVGEIVQTSRGGSVPSIDTRELSTSVLVNNGETIVLGGIFQDERARKEDRVPYLSSIPVLGHLFKRRANETKKRELLIFVTPTIVEERPVVN